MNIYYKGHSIGNRRADFFVEEKVMVELNNNKDGRCSPAASHELFGGIFHGSWIIA